MEISFASKEKVWRGPGHPRRNVPQKVKDLAHMTYRTGKVGQVAIRAEDKEDATELVRLLRSYAKAIGKHMRIQQDDDCLRFEMVDSGTKRTEKASA